MSNLGTLCCPDATLEDVAQFGDMLQLERLTRGLSQEDLAAKASVHSATIKNLEQGVRHKLRGDTAMRLLKALDLESPMDRATVEAMLIAAKLQPGLAAKLYASRQPSSMSPIMQAAYRAVDAMAARTGEEQTLGILQSYLMAIGATSTGKKPATVPGAVAITHPDGVREFIPTAPSAKVRRDQPHAYLDSPPQPPAGTGAPARSSTRARAKS